MAIHSQNLYISLFSGGGGLDRAIRLAMPDARCICYVEREIGAVQILASYMAQKAIDEAPVWSDVATFDGRRFRGRVAGICGGFPCQDLSVAGKQAGIQAGNRSGLFYEYVRIIREVQPEWVAIENVPPVFAFPAGGIVFGELARLGFDAVGGTLRASEVGTSHIRKRRFILAFRKGFRWRERWPESARIEGRSDVAESGIAMDHSAISRHSRRRSGESGEVWDEAWWAESRGRCDDLAAAKCSERRQSNFERGGFIERPNGQRQTPSWAGESCADLADAEYPERGTEPEINGNAYRRIGSGRQSGNLDNSELAGLEIGNGQRGQQLRQASESEPTGLPFFAPGPSDPRWPDILQAHPDLTPALSKFDWFILELRCAGLLPDGLECTTQELGRYLAQNVSREEIKRAVHAVAHGLAGRADWLRVLGNGVVPLQGAVALRILMWRAGLMAKESTEAAA